MSLAQTEPQNEMVECPYDKSHRMLRKRLQQHLIKCRVNHPEVELQTCPFNKTHLIPEPEFVNHVTNCSDRKLITQYLCDAPVSHDDEDRVKQEPIECDENWDDTEVDDYNPRLYVEKANVIRMPDLAQPAQRKAFIKKERKRLGDYNSDDEREDKKKIKQEINYADLDRPGTSDEEADFVYKRKLKREMTTPPPPPPNIGWYEGKTELKDPMSLNHEINVRRKHKHRHTSRSSRELDHSPNGERGLRKRSDNYSPVKERGQSRPFESYSPKREGVPIRRSAYYSPDRERGHSRSFENYSAKRDDLSRHFDSPERGRRLFFNRSTSRERELSRRSYKHSPSRERELSRRFVNHSPKRERERSRSILNYSPVRQREASKLLDKYHPYVEREKIRRSDNYSPDRERARSRSFLNYSPTSQRELMRYVDNYSPSRSYDRSRHFVSYSPTRERAPVEYFYYKKPVNSYPPNGEREREQYLVEDGVYSLDEDPYYNSSASYPLPQQNGRQIQYPLAYLHGRGAYRGHTHLGPFHGRYERPFHEY